MTDDEFDLLTMEEIMDGLARRYSGVAAVVLRSINDSEDGCQTYWRHGTFQAIGLLREGLRQIDKLPERRRDPSED